MRRHKTTSSTVIAMSVQHRGRAPDVTDCEAGGERVVVVHEERVIPGHPRTARDARLDRVEAADLGGPVEPADEALA